MQDFGQPQPYELEADAEIEAYRAGKALIGKHQLNPHHRFGLDELAELLSLKQLRAYIAAWDYDATFATRGQAERLTVPRPRPTAVEQQQDSLAAAIDRFLVSKRPKLTRKKKPLPSSC